MAQDPHAGAPARVPARVADRAEEPGSKGGGRDVAPDGGHVSVATGDGGDGGDW